MLQKYQLRMGFLEGPDIDELFTANTLVAAMMCAKNKYSMTGLKSVVLVGLAL